MKQLHKEFGDWRLAGATVYVTKEPCPMCAGAIVLGNVEIGEGAKVGAGWTMVWHSLLEGWRGSIRTLKRDKEFREFATGVRRLKDEKIVLERS